MAKFLLKRSYKNPSFPGSFGGVKSFAKNVNISQSTAQKWLQSQDLYTLHKPVRINFPRRKTIALDINELWQADLVDVSKFFKSNNGNKFILTIIDVFSKQAYAFPIKRKDTKEMVRVFKRLFQKNIPKLLQTDRGKEFFNRPLRQLFKHHNINHYASYSDKKAAVVERFNRTLKNRMWRIFTLRGNYKYLDILQKLVDSYNNTKHSSIGIEPNKVVPEMRSEIFDKLYPETLKKINYKFSIGDRVRISKTRTTFPKGYLPQWTNEIFIVYDRKSTSPPIYFLKDLKSDIIEGSFYEQELQKVVKSDQDYWPIEKILKTRGRGKNKQYLVKWQGFDDQKFNTWVRNLKTFI